MSISVVINTRNEEKNLPRALASVKSLADEVVVVDMESTDKTVDIARKAGAKVFKHKPAGYVEPARNYAIKKTAGEWIFILDADEELPKSLAKKLKEIAADNSADYYRLPRKNIIFGKWIKHSRWWPDYNIRFFKSGKVVWSEIIHSVPTTEGKGMDLAPQEDWAIIHHNYQSISQYLGRMDRYTDIQSDLLFKDGYKTNWQDFVRKPLGEFISRFLVGEGYKDGLHGLTLALLQAFSELVLYAKVWERSRFGECALNTREIDEVLDVSGKEMKHWLVTKGFRKNGIITRVLRKLLK